MSLEMAHSRDAQSCSLHGWMLSHCTHGLLDEKGAHFTNGREGIASFCNDDTALNWSGVTV